MTGVQISPLIKRFMPCGRCSSACPVAAAEQVRTVIPRATLNYLSVPVAEVKGFFRDQGLENETIVIPGSTAIAALVSGNVDTAARAAPGMRAALRGAPIKAVMFQTEKVTWYLLAAADIQKISDLKGKRVAVGTSAIPRTRSSP